MKQAQPLSDITTQIGNYKLPFFLTLLGFLLYTIGDGFTKEALHRGLFFPATLFFYGFWGMIVSIAYASFKRNKSLLTTRRPGVHLVRSILHTGSMGFLFYAFAHSPMTDVYTLFFVAPIIITILTVKLHGEIVTVAQWGAVALCFIGTLIFLRPGFEEITWINLLPLVAACCFSCSILMIRHYKATEAVVTFNFSLSLFFVIVFTPILLIYKPSFTVEIIMLVSVAALIAMITNLVVLWAHQNAPSIIVSPVQYSQLIWGSLIGFIVWRDVPDIYSVIAMFLIAGSGAYLIYSAQRKSRST